MLLPTWLTDAIPFADKSLHFLISALIFFFDFAIRSKGKLHPHKSTAGFYALRDVFLIGLLKEIADTFGLGEASLNDFIANILGFVFPIYIYFTWRRAQSLADDALFTKGRTVWNEFRQQSQLLSRELIEAIYATARYHLLDSIDLISPNFLSDQKLLNYQKRAQREQNEGEVALFYWFRTLLYSFGFLVFSTAEFLIDLIKMPFWVLGRTLQFLLSALFFLLKPFRSHA